MLNSEPILAATDRRDRPTLENLLDEYLAELSIHRERQVGACRSADYPYLDRLWDDSSRHAFLLSLEGCEIGFLLMRRLDDEPSYELSELFVKSRHRRAGAGAAAVREVFARFPGSWELQVHARNGAALRFWEDVVGRTASGGISRTEIESSDGRRVQFNFDVCAA